MFSLLLAAESVVSSGVETDLQVFLPLLGMTATMVGVLVFLIKSYRQSEIAATESKEINNAVNNVTPGMPTLYQQVMQIKETMDKFQNAQEDFSQKGWLTLPEDINSASGLTSTIRELQHKEDSVEQSLHSLEQRLDTIIGELREHVTWEMSQKYRDPS